ncbi:MAG: Maf family protein [Anaerolineae bacterium]|nr:Maf family protein [Anaerolineae bacterium]
MQNHPKLVLASTSPRRRDLVKVLGVEFEFTSADIDESPRDHESPQAMVRRLSYTKASVGARALHDAIVVGVDTIGWLDNEIIGKPRDSAEAVQMLRRLRARSHIVYSGVTVKHDTRIVTHIVTTTVWMRDYSDEEIAAYVATGDPLDKAAAYAIQHTDFRPVARVEGCHANVMGLPLCHLYLALKAFDVPLEEPDRACQAYLQITCPVAREILSIQYSSIQCSSVQYSV